MSHRIFQGSRVKARSPFTSVATLILTAGQFVQDLNRGTAKQRMGRFSMYFVDAECFFLAHRVARDPVQEPRISLWSSSIKNCQPKQFSTQFVLFMFPTVAKS